MVFDGLRRYTFTEFDMSGALPLASMTKDSMSRNGRIGFCKQFDDSSLPSLHIQRAFERNISRPMSPGLSQLWHRLCDHGEAAQLENGPDYTISLGT